MAFNFTATGTALTPQNALFEYIPSIREYSQVINTSGYTVSAIAKYNYPLRNTYFVQHNSSFGGNAIFSTGGTGSLVQSPLKIDGSIRSVKSADTAPILLIELGKVSDLIVNSVMGVSELVFTPSLAPPSYLWESCFIDDDDITPLADWFYIKNARWYDNSDNGNYDIFNPRKILNETATSYFDVVLPFHCGAWISLPSGGGAQVYKSDRTGEISLLGNCILHAAQYPVGYNNCYLLPYFTRTTTTIPPYGRMIQDRTASARSNKYVAVPNEQNLRDFFALWGINVFFNVEDAETTNIPIQGQPDNPNPDDIPTGTGDNSTDSITYPAIKTEPTAFYNRFFLNPENVDKLKAYLFTSDFLSDFPNGIGRLWNDPMQSIIGLTWYPINPVHVHNIVIRQADEPIKIGNLTDIQAVVGYPFVSSSVNNTPYIDMGSYTVEPYFGRYLDYDGYTSISIYLPYIGERQLITSEVMGKTLKVIYYPDFVNNTFLAVVYADGQPIAQYTASFGVQIPLGGSAHNDYLISVISGVATTALTVGATVATGGGAAMAAIGAAGGALRTATTQEHVKQVGAFTPNTGIYAPQYPYLIISRPYMSRPTAWETLHGNAAGYSTIVGNCTGYIEAEEVQLLSNEIMTAEEQNEIENLLKGGVYA